jgi:hypothetical protein
MPRRLDPLKLLTYAPELSAGKRAQSNRDRIPDVGKLCSIWSVRSSPGIRETNRLDSRDCSALATINSAFGALLSAFNFQSF